MASLPHEEVDPHMHRWVRRTAVLIGVPAMAAGLLVLGAAAGSPPGGQAPAAGPTRTASDGDPLAAQELALQQELELVPGKWTAWSDLGMVYVQQARLNADPGLYARAEGAFAESLRLRPEDNDGALTGQATLAAALHDFARALELTDRALAINDFNATTYAARVDALVELGRYDEAETAAQRLLDLRPGIDAFSRASYVLELRGETERATELMQAALDSAVSPADQAFAHHQLGELAWNTGDLDRARRSYDAGIDVAPDYLPNLVSRARLLYADGDPAAAIGDLAAVAERQPQPFHLLELGETLQADGQDDAAQDQYAVLRATQQLFAAAGQDVDIELALFEADHGTAADAVASAEPAYRKRPDAVFAQQAYAWALHAAGRDAEALPIARASLRTGLTRPDFLYRLGAIEAAAGQTEAARTTLTRALELNPDFSALHAPRARALLESL
jgi:tetratricopeptide (TPR) repeat protein